MSTIHQRTVSSLPCASRSRSRALRRRAGLALAMVAAARDLIQRSVAGSPSAEGRGTKTELVGLWSFDAGTGCETGPAWEFRTDGSYNELLLPDRTPRATGKWHELGDTIFYSLARAETAAPGRPDKRMVIIEREPDRLVSLGGRRVRHVMHRCP